jgi:hypothetical protein
MAPIARRLTIKASAEKWEEITVRVPASRAAEVRAFAASVCPPKPTGDSPQNERAHQKDIER